MKFQIFKPKGFLSNYIKQYCFMESDIDEGIIKERVIPTENIQLMFHYQNPFIVDNPNNTKVQQPRTIISGLSNSYMDVSTQGEAGVIFVSFYPLGACHFLRFPLSEIENRSLDLTDIFSIEIKRIEDMLYSKKSCYEKIAIIETFLISKYSPIVASDYSLLNRAVELINLNNGCINANGLSDMLSITGKSLERKFLKNLGKTTKQYIKLIRFQSVLKDISFNNNVKMTEYAYNNGFYDQSHFIKDFKSYCGLTPKEFVTRYPNFNINGDCF